MKRSGFLFTVDPDHNSKRKIFFPPPLRLSYQQLRRMLGKLIYIRLYNTEFSWHLRKEHEEH